MDPATQLTQLTEELSCILDAANIALQMAKDIPQDSKSVATAKNILVNQLDGVVGRIKMNYDSLP